MKPKELLFNHRYAEAIAAYKQQMMEGQNKNTYSALGAAQLSLKHYHEALLSYKRANELERLGGSIPHLSEIGVSLWLLNERAEAIQTWHKAVAGIIDGSIQYGDPAGGAAQGLLLWYGAVTLDDTAEREYALNYLRKLSKKTVHGKAILWPRPVVLMVLGENTLGEALEIAAGSIKMEEAMKKANTDLLTRRRLCQTIFYAACQDRRMENESECIDKMRLCSQLENPILECEWYLARGEYEMHSSTNRSTKA